MGRREAELRKDAFPSRAWERQGWFFFFNSGVTLAREVADIFARTHSQAELGNDRGGDDKGGDRGRFFFGGGIRI